MSTWTAGGWPRLGSLSLKEIGDERVILWSRRTKGLYSGPKIEEVLDLSLRVGIGEKANEEIKEKIS